MPLDLADQLGKDSEIIDAIDDVSDALNSQPKPNQALMKAIQFQASQLIAGEWDLFRECVRRADLVAATWAAPQTDGVKPDLRIERHSKISTCS